MNIQKTDIDNQSFKLSITIEKDDYQESVEKKLRERRRSAQMKGFRPGKVPMGLIKRMYGTSVRAEEVDSLLQTSLINYLKENDLKPMGQPIIDKEAQEPQDFENHEEFAFHFIVGLRPEIDIEIDQSLELPFYEVEITDEMVDEFIENTRQSLSEQKDETQGQIEEDSLLRCDFYELDKDGNIVEPKQEDTQETENQQEPNETDSAQETDENSEQKEPLAHGSLIALDLIKNDDEKEKFLGAGFETPLVVNLKKALENETEIANLLGVEKEDEKRLNADYQVVIKAKVVAEKPEIDQEFFKKVFPQKVEDGEVHDEESFREAVREELKKQNDQDSKYRFAEDTKKILIEKTNPQLPELFIKKLLTEKQKVDAKELEKDFPRFVEQFKWHEIQSEIQDKYELEVTEDDIRNQALVSTIQQFQMYGMPIQDPEQLYQITEQFLQDEEQRNKFEDQALGEKVMNYINEETTLQIHTISAEEMKTYFEELTKARKQEQQTNQETDPAAEEETNQETAQTNEPDENTDDKQQPTE